ncbi:MAG: GHKL domain-containing protein [Butyrivibrio sp.]|nr:GHKL domain-containing protein [Butyrivibrio sp.]
MNPDGIKIFNNVALGIEILGNSVIFALYVGRLAGGRQYAGLRVWSALVLYGAVYALKVTVLTFPGWAAIVFITAVLAAGWTFCRAARPQRVIFLVLSAYCIQTGCTLIVQSINHVAFDAVAYRIADMKTAYLAVRLFCAGTVALRLAFCSAVSVLTGKLIRAKLSCEILWRELAWLVFIPLIETVFVNVIYRMLAVVKDGTYFELYEMYPSFLAIIPATVLLVFAGVMVSVYICGSMRKLEEERLGSFVRERQIKELERRIAKENQEDEAARRLQHDMRSHFMNLQGLLARGEYDEAMEYIGTAGESIRGTGFGINTGNPVTDVIINDAGERAVSLGIEFRTDFWYEKQKNGWNLELFDLGIAVSNLLTNALEACAGCVIDKYIEISSKIHGNFYLIEVCNSFCGEIKWDDISGLPVSSKRQEGMHGIGLGNVARVADKYNGSMELTAEGGRFKAVVMLQKII